MFALFYLMMSDKFEFRRKLLNYIMLGSERMINQMKQLYLKTPYEWREWLQNNHDKETEVWLIFFRKETGEPSIEYESAVEEALCFGWIDSIIKKIDDAKYARKFTHRKDSSKWSELRNGQIALWIPLTHFLTK